MATSEIDILMQQKLKNGDKRIMYPITKLNDVINEEDAPIGYADLSGKPTINGIAVEGNKSTKDLNISYNDLNNNPTNLSEFTNDILVQSDSEESALASSTGDTKKMYYWVEE